MGFTISLLLKKVMFVATGCEWQLSLAAILGNCHNFIVLRVIYYINYNPVSFSKTLLIIN